MAKLKDGINRSQLIRDLLDKNPHITAKEVITELAGQGVKVKPGLVYFIKGKRKGRIGRRSDAKMAASTAGTDAVSTVLKVKRLALEVGGMKRLKALVDAIAD